MKVSSNSTHHIITLKVLLLLELQLVLTNCTSGDIQLVNGSSDGEGRVEVCYQGVWTTVDGHSWDYNDACVLCRQLGYDDKCENYLARNVDRNFINTKMQGLLPLVMLNMVHTEWSTNIIVVVVKCHFSHVQILKLITTTMQSSGTMILELQLSANKME